MNHREKIERRIELEYAWLDGKTVQQNGNDITSKAPTFHISRIEEYTIKAQAKEIWVNEYAGALNGDLYAHSRKDDAEGAASGGVTKVAVKYREVTD